MPPRIPTTVCLRVSKPLPAINAPCPTVRSFSSTSASQRAASARKNDFKKPKSRDPYILAQAERRKAANVSRRKVLEEKRAESLGDPIRGITTDFVKSFDTGDQKNWKETLAASNTWEVPEEERYLNHFLNPKKVTASLHASERLAVPRYATGTTNKPQQNQYVKPGVNPANMGESGNGEAGSSTKVNGESDSTAQSEEPKLDEETRAAVEAAQADHVTAATAIKRITDLHNGSSKDRLRVNIQRCVGVFGRHKTDLILPPRAPARATPSALVPPRPKTNIEAAKKRVGPDTGSSEVQIAILTAKIRTLADFLESRGKGDKMNKKNLRQLVHRRQKLLQYLRRKERGGPRWQHCIETLGLTEGTWKGEISL